MLAGVVASQLKFFVISDDDGELFRSVVLAARRLVSLLT